MLGVRSHGIGGEIMFIEPSPGIMEYNAIQIADTNGDRRTLFASDEDIWWPTASPDGTRIAYQQGGMIFVLDVDPATGTRVAAFDLPSGNIAVRYAARVEISHRIVEPADVIAEPPSRFSRNRRICSACECGIASCNWNAMDCA